jgi:galactokinase
VRNKFGDEYGRWFTHAYKESARGEAMVSALKAKDMDKLATLMNWSHTSLSELYENSTPLIDAMVKASVGPGLADAGRIGGGGRGGPEVILCDVDKAGAVCQALDRFRKDNVAAIADGHSVGISFVETPPGLLAKLGIAESGLALAA